MKKTTMVVLLAGLGAACADHGAGRSSPATDESTPLGGSDPGSMIAPAEPFEPNADPLPAEPTENGAHPAGRGSGPSGSSGGAAPVPEPTTLLLLGSGLMAAGGLSVYSRRRRRERGTEPRP